MLRLVRGGFRAAEVGQIIRGAAQIASGAMTFAAMATAAQLVLADGKIGAISSLPGMPTRMLVFTVQGDKITAREGVLMHSSLDCRSTSIDFR